MRSRSACLEVLEGRVLLAAFTPDTDFGNGGDAYASYVGSHRDAPRVVTRQPDGKILIVSTAEVTYSYQILLVRLNPDGSYDRTFGGGDGKVRTRLDVPDYYEVQANDVALQPDGKIVVAGESAGRFMVLRFNADGTPDRGFGERGVVIPDLGEYPVSEGGATGVALQRDGKIVAAGWWDSNPEEHHKDTDVIVVRLDADGTLDETFGGGDGMVTTGLGATETGHDVAIDRDGRIVVVGDFLRRGTPETRAHLVTRYNPDGSPDASFSGDGVARIMAGEGFRSLSTVLVRGNTIFAGGGRDRRAIVLKVTERGQLDREFANRGVLWARIDEPIHSTLEILPRPKGKLAVLAAAGFSPGGSIHLLQYNADGSPDRTARHRIDLKSFDGTPYGGKTDAVMTSKGSYVILGASQEKPDDLLIAAVKSNGKVDGNFGKGGTVRLDYRDRIPMRPQGTLVQRDGKIVTWAPLFYPEDVWLISRMNPDGTPDKSFGGGDGKQSIRWKGNWAYVDFMVSEAEGGKMLIAGRHPKGGSIVVRLNADGSRDTSFGTRGTAAKTAEMYIPSLLQKLPDGSVLLGGHDNYPGYAGAAYRLVRYRADGTIDPSMNVGFNIRSFQHFERALPEEDGGVLLVGVTHKGSEDYSPHEGPQPVDGRIVLMKFKADGSRDTSLGADGIRIIDDVNVDRIDDVRRLADGSLMIAGVWASVVTVRLAADGSLLESASTDVRDVRPRFGRSLVESDGDVLVFDEDAVVRVKRDGTIDDSFSSAPIEAEVHVLDEDDNLITADRDHRGFRVRRYELT